MIKLETTAATRVLNVGVILNGNDSWIRDSISARNDMTLKETDGEESVTGMINGGGLDFCIVLDKNFDKNVENLEQGDIRLYFKSSAKNNISKRRINTILEDYKNNTSGGKVP